MGLGEFAKLTRNRNTFESLCNCNELYQHPASLLRKETRVLTRGSECKVSVLLQSARLKFPSSYRKLLDKVFFLNKFLSSSKENITFIFFWRSHEILNNWKQQALFQIVLGEDPIFSLQIQKRRWIRGYFEGLEKTALESVQFIKTLVIKKLHLQQIESQAQPADSCVA